jgi:AcrR family transcriptional regulator
MLVKMEAARQAVRPKRRGGREARYSVEAVLGAALELIDAEGLVAFSMRRVAERMGIGPMTIYGYVRTKEELLDGVVGLALHGVLDDLDLEEPWDEQVRTAVRDLHDALRSHPGVLELLLAKPAPSPQLDLIRETLLGILRRAGFGEEAVWEAVGILSSYAVGFATAQVSFRHVGAASAQVERLGDLPATRFPNLTDLAGGYPAHMSDAAFEWGLTILVDGLRAQLLP